MIPLRVFPAFVIFLTLLLGERCIRIFLRPTIKCLECSIGPFTVRYFSTLTNDDFYDSGTKRQTSTAELLRFDSFSGGRIEEMVSFESEVKEEAWMLGRSDFSCFLRSHERFEKRARHCNVFPS